MIPVSKYFQVRAAQVIKPAPAPEFQDDASGAENQDRHFTRPAGELFGTRPMFFIYGFLAATAMWLAVTLVLRA